MERAQKVRNIATIEMGQGYASVQVKVTGRGHVVPFDSGKHVGPSKVEDMDEFLLWKAENRNLKDQLREAQEKLERLTGDGPDIHGKQSEADDWEDEDDPVGAVKPYPSRKKDDPAASPWNMPAGSPIQMIGDTSAPFELENTTFSPKHLPRPNSSKLVPDPAVGPMMDVEPGLISAVFDDLLPKDLVARLASSSASSSTDIQGAIVECRELIKSWKEKGEASDKQRVILSDKWEAYVEDTESERRA